jgi:flagellar motor protein MotB
MKASSVIYVGALILAGFVSVQASELNTPVPREKFGTAVSAEDLERYALVDLKSIYFIGRTTCSAQAKASLGARAKEWPTQSIIEVRGYADNAGSAGENLLLSGMRAEVVARLLSSMGIPPERVRILALGAIDPDGQAGDPKHQRVDVRVFVEPPAATVPSDASAHRLQD